VSGRAQQRILGGSDLKRIFTAHRGLSLLAALSLFSIATPSSAVVEMINGYDHGLPIKLFDEHMVLQRDANDPVWGTAAPGEHVTVTIASQTKETDAAPNGTWRVVLDPVSAGGPYEMVVAGASNTLTFGDILFGDVWLMAGQSNLMIHRPFPGVMADNPDSRVFKRTWFDRVGGIPFHFARSMTEELGIPVAVLQCTARGSSGLARTWIAPEGADLGDQVIADIIATGNFGQSYEASVVRDEGFKIKGFIWWQGESDTRSRNDPGEEYAHVLPAVVQSWRHMWQDDTLPFLFMMEPVGGGMLAEQTVPDPLPDPNYTPQQSAHMRQAFIRALRIPNTQVITNADLVAGLHPRDREGYLQRIVDAVMGFVYGAPIIFAGPTYQGMSIESGNHVRIRFRPGTATGLQARGGPLQGFSISGDGVTFTWATNAQIEGEEVVVWSDDVPSPTIVRYGYHKEYGFANLANGAGMGAPTFTTDAEPYE